MAAHAFRAAGWDARSMAGGIQAGRRGPPLEPEGGHVADHWSADWCPSSWWSDRTRQRPRRDQTLVTLTAFGPLSPCS